MAAENQSVGVKTYARVRVFFKDRESLQRAVDCKSARETGKKGTLTVRSLKTDHLKALTTEFTDVLSDKTRNEDCFNTVSKPLIDRVLEGYKALLIAYGQTGSGKTFTLIGAKGPGQLGLLPRTIQALLDDPRCLEMRMKGFEAYSTNLQKIPLYDLFDHQNQFIFQPFEPPGDDKIKNKAAENRWVQRKSLAAKALWKSKKGRTGIDTMNEGHSIEIKTIDDGFKYVEMAHDASHFARTGKNPESSRGHTVYILFLKVQHPDGEDFEPLQTEFVVVDLAGSEGGSTLENLPDGPDKTARFLEGGVINYGLTSLKGMFAEMRKKGKLKKCQGNGLRKLLYPFVTSNTHMSIVFTLSPSVDNIIPTRATMKFAQDACKLKMKPAKGKGEKNWQKMYEKLKADVNDKMELINKLEEKLEKVVDASVDVMKNDNLVQKLSTMYKENPDKLASLFQEYEINQHLDEDLVNHIQDALIPKQRRIRELLRELYEKSDPNRLDKVEEEVQHQVDLGHDLKTYYELQCEKYNAEAESVSTQILMSAQKPMTKQNDYLNLLHTIREDMRSQTTMHRMEYEELKMELAQDEQMAELAEEDDIKEQESDEEYEESDLDMLATEMLMEDMTMESADCPQWVIDLDEEVQRKLAEEVKDNIDSNGILDSQIKRRLMHEYDVMEEDVSDFAHYVMNRMGNDTDAHLIQQWHEDVGVEDHDHFDDESRKIIMQLQAKIHEMENLPRVEETLRHIEDDVHSISEKQEEEMRMQRAFSKKQEQEMKILSEDHEMLSDMRDTMLEENKQLKEENKELSQKYQHVFEELSELRAEKKMQEDKAKAGELGYEHGMLQNQLEQIINELHSDMEKAQPDAPPPMVEVVRSETIKIQDRSELTEKLEESMKALSHNQNKQFNDLMLNMQFLHSKQDEYHEMQSQFLKVIANRLLEDDRSDVQAELMEEYIKQTQTLEELIMQMSIMQQNQKQTVIHQAPAPPLSPPVSPPAISPLHPIDKHPPPEEVMNRIRRFKALECFSIMTMRHPKREFDLNIEQLVQSTKHLSIYLLHDPMLRLLEMKDQGTKNEVKQLSTPEEQSWLEYLFGVE